MSHNPYECRYNFGSEEPTFCSEFIAKNKQQSKQMKVVLLKNSDESSLSKAYTDTFKSNPIEKLTDEEFAELIYSSSNQTD